MKNDSMKDAVIQIIEQANCALERGDFKTAQIMYEEAFSEGLEKLRYCNTVIKGSKIAGWVATFLTGGFGFEDIFIIPAVSKGIIYITGIKPDEIFQIVRYSTFCELYCIINIPELLDQKSEYYYLKKFALLYKDSNRDLLNLCIDLYFPSILSSQNIELEKNPYDLIPIIKSKIRTERDANSNLNKLLYLYATHFGWNSILDELTRIGMYGYIERRKRCENE